jgi:class 3 adenylate cyclase
MLRVALVWLFSVLIGAIFLSPLNLIEMFFLDARFVITAAFSGVGDSTDDIAIVLMNTESESELGVPVGSEWREFFPDFIHTLDDAGSKAIVFDLEFLSEEVELDAEFARQISAAGNVIAGEWDYNTTIEGLADAFSGIGSLRVEAVKGNPRRIRFPDGEGRLPLSILAAELFTGRKTDDSVVEGGGFWIFFDSPSDRYPAFVFSDVYLAENGRISDERKTPLSIFKDKIVLVGIDLPGLDRHAFPYTFGSKIPGVFGQAAAIQTALSEKFLIRPSVWVNLCILAVFAAVYCLIFDFSRIVIRRILIVSFPAVIFAGSIVIFSQAHVWIGFAPIFVSSLAAASAHWTVSRGILRSGLRRAIGFDPELVNRFRRQAKGGVVQANIAVLCADVRDYTAFVSRIDPDKVSSVMNEYLHAMEEIISSEHGYVNKYVGDEIIAVFGFPLSSEQTALRAVRSARAMLTALDVLVSEWGERGIAGIQRIGIGIDCGTVTFAEMGGRSRRQFDIIGNAINGASRLQTLTKEVGYNLAVSKEVYDELLQDDEEKLVAGTFNPLGAYSIRGQGERLVYVYSKKQERTDES